MLFFDNSTLTDRDYHVSFVPLPYSKLESKCDINGQWSLILAELNMHEADYKSDIPSELIRASVTDY